jgi:hypothetical protein
MINLNFRVLLARIFLPFFTVWCVTVPRQVFSSPLLVLVPVAEIAVETAAGQSAINGALLLGTAVLSVLFSEHNNGVVNTVKLEQTNRPRQPSVIEAAAGFTAGSPSLIPASIGSVPSIKYYASGATSQTLSDTANTACGLWAVNIAGYPKYEVIGTVCHAYLTDPAQYAGANIYSQFSCTPGYTVSNDTCVLTAPAAVPRPSDHFCPIIRAGSTYMPDPADPDCFAGVAPAFAADGSWFIRGSDGVTISGKAIPAPAGQVSDTGWQRLSIVSPDPATKTTKETIIDIAPSVPTTAGTPLQDSPPVIAGVRDTVTPGIGTGTDPIVIAAPAPVQFPSDYARTGEAQVAADTINTRLDTLHNDLSNTSIVSDPASPSIADMPWFGTTFSGLSGWSMPGHISTCPTATFDLSAILGAGKVYVMNSQCSIFQNNSAPLRAAAILSWLILSIFIVLRA